MQTLDISKAKNFQFEVDINGIDSTELKGLFEFIIDGVHYGFPADIKESNIKVDVPPLTEVVKKDITSGSVLECYLSVYGNGFHLEPWKGSFEISSPIRMEAKMTFSDVEEELKTIPQKVVKEKVEEETSYEKELLEIAGPSPMRVEKTRKPKINKQELYKRIIKEELTYVKTGKRINDISKDNKYERSIRSKVRKNLREVLKRKVRSKKIIKEDKKNKDPKALMESLGMKNESTQERMIEKAESMGGKDSVYDTLKKLLGV